MILNVNVGILGHVDSGKTSLSKALSTAASTAAFDKDPQSQKRGITLDLGFSSFIVRAPQIPPHLTSASPDLSELQVTLVDCPGHASLIRTIICGANIIDLMLLVVDVNKGFQTQTAECLIIGELTCNALVVVLNKTDLLLPVEKRQEKIAKMKSRIAKTLEPTKFKNAPIVAVSALASSDGAGGSGENGTSEKGIADLIRILVTNLPDHRPGREARLKLPFLFAVDHCFVKSGQGTVLTGTVLHGSASLGDTVEIPQQRLQKKIKSMQVFRKPVEKVGPGDRAGICITQLDAGVMERGFLAKPGLLSPSVACLIAPLHLIRYFKGKVTSKTRFHISIGQDTVLAHVTCLRRVAQTEEYEYVPELTAEDPTEQSFMMLEFDAPLVAPMDSLVIGSRLDTDASLPTCRLAFHGRVHRLFSAPTRAGGDGENFKAHLNVFRKKSRQGEVERMTDSRSCIVRGLFRSETNWEIFRNFRVHVRSRASASADCSSQQTSINVPGVIEGSFGQSGKCRIRLTEDLPDDVVDRFARKPGKKNAQNPGDAPPIALDVVLEFKKNVFDSKKKFTQ